MSDDRMLGGSWMKGPNKINAKELVFMGACQRAVNEFRALFGDGDVEICFENLMKLHRESSSANLYCAWLAEKIVGPVSKEFWEKIGEVSIVAPMRDPLHVRERMVYICLKYLGARETGASNREKENVPNVSSDKSTAPKLESNPSSQPPSPPVQAEVQRGGPSPDSEAPRA